MRAFIRADASTHIGSGHVVRTKTLAWELMSRGAEVTYVCRQVPGDFVIDLRSEGFKVVSLSGGRADDVNCNGSWPVVSQRIDAKETIQALGEGGWDLVVADHYCLDHVWELALRPCAPKIMVIDDLANRKHVCDLLLDQSLTERSDRYHGLVPEDCLQLLGLRYALLKDEYALAREHLPAKTSAVGNVFIFFGGSDEDDLTGRALAALSHPSLREIFVNIVVGANYRHLGTLERQAMARGATRVHRNLPHLADLMSAADLAIGGGGTTTWERLCLGLPSLVVSVADNQTANCQTLEAAGLIKYLGTGPTLEAMRSALEWATANIDQMRENAERGQRLVDGFGAKRVAEVLLPSAGDQLSLRTAAPSDAALYYAWVNDPRVRANSLQTAEIRWDDHVAWFAEKLGSPRVKLYVLQARGLPLGQIRVEEGDGVHWLNYSLDPIARGRGWGRKLVEMGCHAAHEDGASAFRAKVKRANVASAALLLGLGFKEEPRDIEDDLRIFEIRIAKQPAGANK